MWLSQHPAVWHGQVTNPGSAHYPPHFGEVSSLCFSITHMLNYMIGKDHVECRIRERQIDSIHLMIFITLCNLTTIHHIHGRDLATQLRMGAEIMRNPSRTGTYLKHPNWLWTVS
ncbi:MAG: hypothetical protein RSP_22780 [Rhodanobacter sp.]